MRQLFGPLANTLVRVGIIGAILLALGLSSVVAAFWLSPNVTQVGVPIAQPVPFNHQEHAGSFAISCRYCHTTVEKSAFAGLPATEACMACHSQIWNNNPVLEPVRASYRTGEPLHWNRVHNMPDYVFFRHDAHVAKGVGCSTCHGRVDKMPVTWKAQDLRMDWCVKCHQNPLPYIRSQDEIYDMAWTPPSNQVEIAPKLAQEYGLRTQGLIDCYTCHR